MVAAAAIKQLSRLLHDFTGILKLLNRDEQMCYGLTWPQAFTVEELAEHNALTMTELGGKMGVAFSTATRILDVLVRDGLVERRPGRQDRRQVVVVLTEKGRDVARKLAACKEKALGALLEPLSPAERKTLLEALATVRNGFQKTISCC